MPRRFKLIGRLTLAVCLTDLTAIATIMPTLVSWALKESLYGQNPNNLLSLLSFLGDDIADVKRQSSDRHRVTVVATYTLCFSYLDTGFSPCSLFP
jgi:hypothetical protein